MNPTVLAHQLGLTRIKTGSMQRALSFDDVLALAVRAYWKNRRAALEQQRRVEDIA